MCKMHQHDERKTKMKKERYINIDDEASRELCERVRPEVAKAIVSEPMDDFILDMDIKTTVESLPETERAVCLLLMDGCSLAEISDELKIAVEELRQKHLPFIRQRFLDYGFEAHEINL